MWMARESSITGPYYSHLWCIHLAGASARVEFHQAAKSREVFSECDPATRLNGASLAKPRTRQHARTTERRCIRSRSGTVQGVSVGVGRGGRFVAEFSSRTRTVRPSESILDLIRNPPQQTAPGLNAEVRQDCSGEVSGRVPRSVSLGRPIVRREAAS